MSDDATKPALFVKKAESKKGSLWNKLTNGRIIKQHGGFDIPEDDLHAIPKYDSPVQRQNLSSEETKVALSDLEKEIKQLKENKEQTPKNEAPHHTPQQNSKLPWEHEDQDDNQY